MKKNYFFKSILLLVPITAFILMSYHSGVDSGNTGSPGDNGNSCAACHSSVSTGVSVAITTSIPSAGYNTSTQYNITVAATGSMPVYGFQLTAENANNTKVGSFTAGTGSRVSGKRVTHSNPNNKVWSFTWTSPATDVGSVTFYAAAVAGNGNGSASGDKTMVTSTSGFTVLGLAKENQLDFTVYPNPVKSNLNIQLKTGTFNANVEIFDASGKLIKKTTISAMNSKVDVSKLSSGIYILKLKTEGKIGLRKIIKE